MNIFDKKGETMLRTILLPAMSVLLAACATAPAATPRDKFIEEHYADVVAIKKKTSSEEMKKLPAEEVIKFFQTLQKIGLYDVNEKDNGKVLSDYVKKTQTNKEKRIAEIKKSTKTYGHGREDIENAVDNCTMAKTESMLFDIVKAAGDEKFFANGDIRLKLLEAANGMLCACSVTKQAPKFTPQALKDYSTYIKSGNLMIVKTEAYRKFRNEGYDMYALFYNLAKIYNALDDDAARMQEVNVFDWFVANDIDECLNDLRNIIEKRTPAAPAQTAG